MLTYIKRRAVVTVALASLALLALCVAAVISRPTTPDPAPAEPGPEVVDPLGPVLHEAIPDKFHGDWVILTASVDDGPLLAVDDFAPMTVGPSHVGFFGHSCEDCYTERIAGDLAVVPCSCGLYYIRLESSKTGAVLAVSYSSMDSKRRIWVTAARRSLMARIDSIGMGATMMAVADHAHVAAEVWPGLSESAVVMRDNAVAYAEGWWHEHRKAAAAERERRLRRAYQDGQREARRR